MCGITGIVRLYEDEVPLSLNIENMTNKIKHRGPDDEGYVLFSRNKAYIFSGDDTQKEESPSISISYFPDTHIHSSETIRSSIALGHRRLSIIDLSPLGHQPMFCLNRYWIVYNGEIFNYIEIREELVKNGYSFISHTDTEVLVAAYDCWGTDCLPRLNGMWAFCIYDVEKKKLFLSRDRFGIKPLYYYFDKSNFIFASEIKAILAHNEVVSGPNMDYCKEYLKTGPKEYIKETAFKNIQRLMHSSFIETDLVSLQNKDINETVFWRLPSNTKKERFNPARAKEFADQYLEKLSDAVRIRLRADVKIGSALSGGLDSSTIAFLTNQHQKKQGLYEKLETFSNVYKSEKAKYCDESAFIDELSIHLNVKSNQIEPKLEDIPFEHGKMIYAMENPAVGPNMGGWYTFKLIAQSNIKINLDGQGADEQLAGYFSFLWVYFANLDLKDLYKEFKVCFSLPNINKINLVLSVLFNIIKRFIPRRILEFIVNKLGNPVENKVPLFITLNEALNQSTVTGLINLIHFGDSQSMAHSVESRMPFMDYRLMEFLATVPSVYKIHSGWTKYCARIAMDKNLPDDITWRKDKMGWPDPSEYWFRGPLKKWLCDEIESSLFLKTLPCPKDITKLIDKKKYLKVAIRMLNLSVWHKAFFDKTLKA